MPRKMRTTPRKSPRQTRSADTVKVLLEATARILMKDGYDRCSTNRIAKEAGVSVGSLYQYFPSKEAIVAALVEDFMSEELKFFEQKFSELKDASVRDGSREIVRALLAHHQVNPKLHKVLFEEIPRVGRLEKLRSVEERVGELALAFLSSRKSELRPENLEMAVFMLVHAVHAVLHATLSVKPELLGEELTEELTDLMTRYLLK